MRHYKKTLIYFSDLETKLNLKFLNYSVSYELGTFHFTEPHVKSVTFYLKNNEFLILNNNDLLKLFGISKSYYLYFMGYNLLEFLNPFKRCKLVFYVYEEIK